MGTLVRNFSGWTITLEYYRLPIMVGMIMLHGNVTIPLTMWSMNAANAGDAQILMLLIATFGILVTNLAAMPTRVTVPVFIVSTVIHCLMIAFNVFSLFLI